MPNEIRLHNNAEGSRQIPKVLKDHQFRRALGFFGGFVHWGQETNQQQSCGQQTLPMPDRFCVQQWQRVRFFQIVRAIHFVDKTTRNQRRSADKLAPIGNVFEKYNQHVSNGTYTKWHTTFDEQLVVFSGKCTYRVFIKSKPGKYWIKLWVAADAKNFYARNIQVYTGKSGGLREKKQRPSRCKIYDLSHVFNWKVCYCW